MISEPRHESHAGGSAPSLAYLASAYPWLSMTFILREIVQLRQMGFRIDVAAINPPDHRPGEMTAIETEEAASTYYLKKHGLRGAALAHVQVLAGNTRGYFRALAIAVHLGGLDLKRQAFNFMYFTEALMVGLWMRKMHQRHLHVHLGQQAATVGMLVRHAFGFGLSITFHGPNEFYEAQAQYLTEKIEAANFLCCISFFARSQLMMFSSNRHWKKMHVSHLGVDPQVFSPKRHNPRPEIFEILCVGRLTPAKGQHELIQAVCHLAAQGRGIRLRLVGGGIDSESLKQMAAQMAPPELVVFEGAVNQDAIRRFFAVADLFCLPSFAEGIPVVLMEAMSMEIPCVTTRIAGIPELIRDGVDGLLVAPSDLDGLVSALARLMDDEVLRERLGKAGRARILEHYDLERNVTLLAAIFRERLKT